MNKTSKIAIFSTSIVAAGIGVFVYMKKRVQLRILRNAKSFLGQKEVHPNQAFLDPNFQNLMYTIGNWRPGFEWCACFARLIWLLSLDEKRKVIANKLLSPSTQQTFANFMNDNSGLFEVSAFPKPGSIVIWQSSKEPAKGHAGIYVGQIPGFHIFIEGNKNNQVSITKYSNYHQISKILKLRGFINIKQ